MILATVLPIARPQPAIPLNLGLEERLCWPTDRSFFPVPINPP